MGIEMTTAWMDLRNAALSAIRRGWPVTPATYLGTDQRWCGRPGACTFGPVSDTWQHTPVTNPGDVYEVWSAHPYGVLLVCGHGVDVLELPQRLVALLRAPEVPRTPVVATARPERWLLFTTTGSKTLTGELVVAKTRLHTVGDWVALPPTITQFLVPQQWVEPPPRSTGVLPTTDEVQAGLLAVLERSRLEAGIGDGEG